MSYCPEDGQKMDTVFIGYHACYTCPGDSVHWFYNGDEARYETVPLGDCPNEHEEVRVGQPA